MHYYKFNISDWALHTSHLSLEEEAVYFRLINYYYDTESLIPLETQSVIRRLRLANNSDIVDLILSEFFIKTSDGYIHNRCEIDIEEYHKKAKSNKSNGKLGGRPKKINNLDNNPEITQVVSENNPNITLTTNYKPLTNNQEPLTNIKPNISRKNALDSGFDEFWNAYPKKVGKDAARKTWLKVNPRIYDVLNSLAWQIESEQWQKQNGQFIPNPATYLNQGRWKDEPPLETSF